MVTQKVYNLSSLGPSKHVNNTTIVHTYIQNNTSSTQLDGVWSHGVEYTNTTYRFYKLIFDNPEGQ